jgi:hypothetical protein
MKNDLAPQLLPSPRLASFVPSRKLLSLRHSYFLRRSTNVNEFGNLAILSTISVFHFESARNFIIPKKRLKNIFSQAAAKN